MQWDKFPKVTRRATAPIIDAWGRVAVEEGEVISTEECAASTYKCVRENGDEFWMLRSWLVDGGILEPMPQRGL